MDELYIKKVLVGELDAFGYLVRQHQNLAMRTALAIVKNETDAKDIVQNSFLQAYESLAQFRGEAKFSTWFCRIVVNKSLQFMQRKQRHEWISPELPSEDLATTHNEGLLALKQADLAALIQSGLDRLAPKEALCIQLFYLEEFHVDEIVTLTGLTQSNVKVLLHRGRKNLYHHLITRYPNND